MKKSSVIDVFKHDFINNLVVVHSFGPPCARDANN